MISLPNASLRSSERLLPLLHALITLHASMKRSGVNVWKKAISFTTLNSHWPLVTMSRMQLDFA